MAKKAAARNTTTWTKITPFRFKADTLADIDAVAAELTATTGLEHSRADAIRVVMRREAAKVRKRKGP